MQSCAPGLPAELRGVRLPGGAVLAPRHHLPPTLVDIAYAVTPGEAVIPQERSRTVLTGGNSVAERKRSPHAITHYSSTHASIAPFALLPPGRQTNWRVLVPLVTDTEYPLLPYRYCVFERSVLDA